MADWDLKTQKGLREACAELEGQLSRARIAEVTGFLTELAGIPGDQRASKDFQDRIWRRNPIRNTQEYVRSLGDADLREWFAGRTRIELPPAWEQRGEALWQIYWDALNHPGVLQTGDRPEWRPRAQTLRTLVALFPEHLTGAIRSRPLQSLRDQMGGPWFDDGHRPRTERACRDQLLSSNWIRYRLDEVLGKPEGMEGNARRLLMSGELAELVSGKRESAQTTSQRETGNVWLFRAGKDGEDEEAWLDQSLAFLGFQEVGDLTGANDDEAVRTRVAVAHPKATKKQVQNWTSQLRQFAVEPRLDDFVVMPRKRQQTVAVGRVAGDYTYAHVDGRLRHTRPVVWEEREVPRDRLGVELVKSLGFAGTVCWLGGEKAAGEIREALEDRSRLDPLPAARRRKGIPAVPGGFNGMLAILDYVRDHPNSEDIRDYLRTEFPNRKERTLEVQFRQLKAGFDCIRISGDRVEITDIGRRLVETRDPDVLRDRLLTKVLGPDHVVVGLGREAKNQSELIALLQRANPGWGATFGPSFQLQWLRSLDVVRKQDEGPFTLTERGKRWWSAIHWEPEPLPRAEEDLDRPPGPLAVPRTDEIVNKVAAAAEEEGLRFDRKLIETLHLGLWSNEQRHFGLLAGLSGSGKTQLAMQYARALTGKDDESATRFCAVSAAPGWHDPTALLGYVNPLDGTYSSTDFVRFLIHAADQAEDIHVCLLDEMNLSHPEQYLAPILSAMERRGGMIELHDGDEEELGVPKRIRYPRNMVLLGTVNMDETTMGISDKVLDRAFTLEFWDIEVDSWPGWNDAGLPEADKERVRRLLNELMTALRPARLHFGWRVIAEFVAFLARRADDSAGITFEQALDELTYAKILPKLRGDDSARNRDALRKCRDVVARANLERSTHKVKELEADLGETGSFRFWR